MPAAARVLLLPGLGNSGPEHWQSYWERERPDCLRIVQDEWERPRREDWVRTLHRALRVQAEPVVLAAHSLGCALVAWWAAQADAERLSRVAGTLLVAPSDVEAPSFPPGASGFAPLPLQPLPFPSTLVYSTDDAFVSAERARGFAARWGSRAVCVGAAGHLDSASALRRWSAGEALLEGLLAGGVAAGREA